MIAILLLILLFALTIIALIKLNYIDRKTRLMYRYIRYKRYLKRRPIPSGGILNMNGTYPAPKGEIVLTPEQAKALFRNPPKPGSVIIHNENEIWKYPILRLNNIEVKKKLYTDITE